MINKKLFATFCLLSVVVFMAMSPAKQEEKEKPKFTNLKVLPKNISDKLLHNIMDEWAHALGARCSFCHARNEETKKMDFASDAKPEKKMARHMFKMVAMLNKKYFEAKKDTTGMIMESGVNCNTCHKGVSHPEIVKASAQKNAPGAVQAGPPAAGQGSPAVTAPAGAPPSGK